jgi:thiol-disulfide isomerase/thioredoxin
MDKLRVYFNNLSNVIVTLKGNVLVVRRFGYLFLLWNTLLQLFIAESFDYNPCFLTNVKLQRLCYEFGHLSVAKLQKVLEQLGHNVDKFILEYLTKYCNYCQKYKQLLSRFKFNLKDDVDFNYFIIVNVFYINGKLVLYIVDEGT